MGEFEQALRDIFGDSIDRLTKFQSDQVRKVSDRVREIAREAVREDIARLEKEVAELKGRLATLESESNRNR